MFMLHEVHVPGLRIAERSDGASETDDLFGICKYMRINLSY